MSLNGPPKASQEKISEVKTPEYWKENLPFKSPRKLYELQFQFANLMAEREGITLVEAIDRFAPVLVNNIHTFDKDWNSTGLREGITDENLLERAWEISLARHVEINSKPTPYHDENGTRFGCHYYNYDEQNKTISVHFFNAEFEEEWVGCKDISRGPLAKEKLERRKHELSDMFRDIKEKHPDALRVHGKSNLYSMKPAEGEDRSAYLRLYPPTYEVGDIVYDLKPWSQGTTVWGQFLGGNNKTPGEYGFKEDMAASFMEKVKDTPTEKLAEALPQPPRTAEGKIQDFYDFYGIT